MNNIFNIKRFGLVFRKDFLENRKLYVLLFPTLFGLMVSGLISMSWNYCYNFGNTDHYNYLYHNRELLIFLSFAFLAGGLLFASTFMTPMNSKLNRLSYLISPSSDFEKFFSRWLIVTVGYILAFFAAMWIADLLRVAVITARYPDLEINFLDLTKLVYPGDDNWLGGVYLMSKIDFTVWVSIYFFFQSLFLLGSTFWEKASFVKTFVAISVIVFVYIMLCRWSMLLSYEEGLNGLSRVMASFIRPHSIEKRYMLVKTILSVFTLTNWILAFFRFRESEIIKRL